MLIWVNHLDSDNIVDNKAIKLSTYVFIHLKKKRKCLYHIYCSIRAHRGTVDSISL